MPSIKVAPPSTAASRAWFAEIERRCTDARTHKVSEFGRTLQRTFIHLMRFIMEKEGIEQEPDGSLRWSEEKQTEVRDPELVLELRLCDPEGASVKAFLLHRASEVKHEFARCITSALRGAYTFLKEQDLCKFDPQTLETPGSQRREALHPLVEEMLNAKIALNSTRIARRCEIARFIRYLTALFPEPPTDEAEDRAWKTVKAACVAKKPERANTAAILGTVTGLIVYQPARIVPEFMQTVGAHEEKHLLASLRLLYHWIAEIGGPQYSPPGRGRTNTSPRPRAAGPRPPAPAKKRAGRPRNATTKVVQPAPNKSGLKAKAAAAPAVQRRAKQLRLAKELIEARDRAILLLVSENEPQLDFGQLLTLRRDSYDPESGSIRMPADSKALPVVQLSGPVRRQLDQYVHLVEGSRWRTVWENETAHLFFADDGGMLTVDDSPNSQVEDGYLIVRNRVITLLMRTVGLQFMQIAALRRKAITSDFTRLTFEAAKLRNFSVGPDLQAAFRIYFQQARINNLANYWTMAEDWSPLFFAADAEELTA